MTKKKQIENEKDIKKLVQNFYNKIRKDQMLAPVFNEVLKGNLENHMNIMCEFWSSILLSTGKYLNNASVKQALLFLEIAQFDQWLTLFDQTIDELFFGFNASHAKGSAINITKFMKAQRNCLPKI